MRETKPVEKAGIESKTEIVEQKKYIKKASFVEEIKAKDEQERQHQIQVAENNRLANEAMLQFERKVQEQLKEIKGAKHLESIRRKESNVAGEAKIVAEKEQQLLEEEDRRIEEAKFEAEKTKKQQIKASLEIEADTEPQQKHRRVANENRIIPEMEIQRQIQASIDTGPAEEASFKAEKAPQGCLAREGKQIEGENVHFQQEIQLLKVAEEVGITEKELITNQEANIPIYKQHFREVHGAVGDSNTKPKHRLKQQHTGEQPASVATFPCLPTANTALTANINTAAITVNNPNTTPIIVPSTKVTMAPAPYQDTEDVETVYSEASSIATLPKKLYIAEFADALFDGVPVEQPDSSVLTKISMVLPELLKSFALKLGYNTTSQMHRDAMFFAHKNRCEVTEAFIKMCSREEVDVPFEIGTTSTNMTVDEKMSLWHEKSEYTYPHDQLPLGEERLSEETLQEMTETDENEAENFESLLYRDLIFNAPAFEWLLESVRREFLLASTEPNCMESIKNRIIEALPSSHKVSKHRSAEAFKAIFTTGWKPLQFLKEEGYQNEIGQAIEGAITITGSSIDAQAVTCAQYMCQTWSQTGVSILDLIKDVIRDESQRPHTRTLPDITELTSYLEESSELIFEVVGTRNSVAEIGQQLAWLCTALSRPFHRTGVINCIPFIKDIQVLNSQKIQSTALPSDFPRRSKEEKENNAISNGQCWHNLFRNPLVVQGYPIPRRRRLSDAGLEIPLNIMAALARTRHIQVFDNRPFVRGFSTILVPTRKDETILLWHLVYNENGNRVSYFEATALLDATAPLITGLLASELETVRHIVGWCSVVDYRAGAADANYEVRPSRLPKTDAECLLHRVSIPRRREIQGVPQNLGNKDTPSHASGNISIRKLSWIHTRYIVLWDEQENRGWLVNGTSALLHLLRKSLESEISSDFGSYICFKKEQMQESPKPWEYNSAIYVLLNENNLGLKIYRDEDYCIRDRLEQLYDAMDKIIEHQDNIAKRCANLNIGREKYLEGWDFCSLATNQDMIKPRVAELRDTCIDWISFTRAIQAVVLFGHGFGEILKPRGGYPCTRWANLPTGSYYLAAAVGDLKKIMYTNGGQDNPLKLTDDIRCHSSQDVFSMCECKGKGDVEQHSDLTNALVPSIRGTLPPNGYVQLHDRGEINFGSNRSSEPRFMETDNPNEHEYISSSERPSMAFRDSGLGSSFSYSLENQPPRNDLGKHISYPFEDYKVGIVCALPKELLAVRALFDNRHERLEPLNDTNHYALGSIHKHNVVAAGLPYGEYGISAATNVLVHMKRSFPALQICLLVGIGGGVPSGGDDGIRLGDIVVSRPIGKYHGVIQYDLGKALENGGFQRTGFLQAPPRFIMTAITDLDSDPQKLEYPLKGYLKTIASKHEEYKYPGRHQDPLLRTSYGSSSTQISPRPSNQPRIHYGIIASGNQVIKNAELRDRLAGEYGAICFEMEAAGVMNEGSCLVIRGICDYADAQKNDIWQNYAAAAAAAYAKLLLSYVKIPHSTDLASETSRFSTPQPSRGPTYSIRPNNSRKEPKIPGYRRWQEIILKAFREK
ncbi:hypothetical protein TWF694_002035 [Orbilia ellipsospora]|uniref:Nucleoside phosphorylase domain-containing protein n=1 Tax=Orbilia ellipsospora TaxID=2528407 RepID=A0AAV9X4P2_9PEZI